MKSIRSFAVALGTASLVAGTAFAGGHGGNPDVKARQAHMQLFGYNLGIVGNMASGKTEYNADIAKAAASNLAAVANLNQSTYWAPGTDSGSIEGSRAKAALWENISDAIAISTSLAEAANALVEVAGDGQAALGPALGPIGKACSDCHKAYRETN